jgi:hypothetical protein
VQVGKLLFSGFISDLKFGFLTARIVLNVLERRKKDKITAEVKPHSGPFCWLWQKNSKNDLTMRTPYSLEPIKKYLNNTGERLYEFSAYFSNIQW